MTKLKKILITALSSAFAVCAMSALTACGGSHEHSFGEWSDLVNICTDHVQFRECLDCGLKETNTLQTAGHTYGDWSDVVDTCDKHVQSRTCTKCGTKETNELLTDGHNYGLWERIVDTCTERVSKRECLDCGHVEINDKLFPKGHNFNDWTDYVNSCTDHVMIHICQNEGCGLWEYKYYKTEGHSFGDWEDLISTCTERVQVRSCSECGVEETQEAEPLSHTFVDNRCIYCGKIGYNGVSLDYLDKYNGTYGLSYFAKSERYAEYAFYRRIDEQVRIFHANTSINAQYQSISGNPSYVVSKIEYADLGLTSEQAASVWKTFKDDNPLYYWMANNTSVEDNKRLILLCYSEYAQGSARKTANELIYREVEEYLSILAANDNEYSTALAFHDKIINTIDYAYKADGTTPSDEAWAHNILGLFEERGGTCETYARAFQILLNVAGVENVFVSGTSGGVGHAWNLVKLDDGNWYWCDLTVDDTPTQQTGITYNYFMVNDTQSIDTASVFTPTVTFLDTHVYETPSGTAVNFLYELPARSEVVYSNEKAVTLFKSFNTLNAVYVVSGYDTVQLVNSIAIGVLNIPENVTYAGKTYTVASIGGLLNGKFSDIRSALNGTETSVIIPKTVKYIWDRALSCAALKEITVNAENGYYKSVDGVLFTKSGEYLVQYPAAKADTSYTTPDGCLETVAFAFEGISNLNTLNIGRDIRGIGICGWFGIHYGKSSIKMYRAGELAGICQQLVNGGKITVHSENARYVADENAIYSINATNGLLKIECIFDSSITSFELAQNVYKIDDGVFKNLNSLESITVADGNEYMKSVGGIVYNKELTQILLVPNAIKGEVVLPDTVTDIWGTGTDGISNAQSFWKKQNVTVVSFGKNIKAIGDGAFAHCTSLTTINFNGTLNEWKAVEKHNGWCSSTGNIRIVCTNGTCDKNGNIIA